MRRPGPLGVVEVRVPWRASARGTRMDGQRRTCWRREALPVRGADGLRLDQRACAGAGALAASAVAQAALWAQLLCRR